MRKSVCKTVRREIDELERGQEPGAMTRAHLGECGSCGDFYAGRLQLQQMIGDLEAVKAPGDFDFRLRARLANERSRSASRFSPGAFGFGLPSVALALIAIFVGVGLFIRVATDNAIQPSAGQSETRQGSESKLNVTKIVPESPQLEAASATNDIAKAVNSEQTGRVARDRKNRRGSKTTNTLRNDFVARSESAAVFPLEAAEPLRVSVDYATGGSRTISLPAVSFGSQQVVAQGASMMKTSARTVW
jgi:hypothetical protein